MMDEQTGVLVRGMGGLYTARREDGAEFVLRAKKKLRAQGLSPLVGDRVRFIPGSGDMHGWVEAIEPRDSVCLRPPCANVTLEIIVVAPVPAPDLLLVDRLLVRAARQGLACALAVNKHDLDASLGARLEREYAGAGVSVLPVSAVTGQGLDALRARMTGRIVCMAGQSGVGKSTLLSVLLDKTLKQGDISARIERGKHTTRHAELLEGNGLRVMDTPGFSLLSLEEGMPPETLQLSYPEFARFQAQCRFSPCMHRSEPGCALRAAVERGEVSRDRVERYYALLDEVNETWRNRYDSHRSVPSGG